MVIYSWISEIIKISDLSQTRAVWAPIWLVVWIFFIFPYLGNFIIPIDELIFFRGVAIPPTSHGFFFITDWWFEDSNADLNGPKSVSRVRIGPWSKIHHWSNESNIYNKHGKHPQKNDPLVVVQSLCWLNLTIRPLKSLVSAEFDIFAGELPPVNAPLSRASQEKPQWCLTSLAPWNASPGSQPRCPRWGARESST